MKFLDKTETKLSELFRNSEFQDFMFECVFGDSKDEDGISYRQVYCHELITTENELIYLVKSHIHHNIPLNRQSIISFVLENIVENLGSDDINCMNTKFFAVCNQLYYMIFDVIKDDYKFGTINKENI